MRKFVAKFMRFQDRAEKRWNCSRALLWIVSFYFPRKKILPGPSLLREAGSKRENFSFFFGDRINTKTTEGKKMLQSSSFVSREVSKIIAPTEGEHTVSKHNALVFHGTPAASYYHETVVPFCQMAQGRIFRMFFHTDRTFPVRL